MDETLSPEAHGELSRATALVGPEFVAKMKYKLKELTLRRMEAEKVSVDATIEDEDVSTFIFESMAELIPVCQCPICMDVFTDATVTACSHIFCRECIGKYEPQCI